MKGLCTFLPLIVFFIVYKIYDIFVSTKVLIVTTALMIFYQWYRYRKIDQIALITFSLVAMFGGMTIYFHSDKFIKWKVTVTYGLYASLLLISHWLMDKPLIQCMLDTKICLPKIVWSRLNIAWALFFAICSLTNTYIAFFLPENIWVIFKVFGLTALTLMFALCNAIYIYRHISNKNNL